MNTQRPKNNKKNSVKPKTDETKITPFSELSKDEKILYVNTYLLYLFKDQIKNYKKIKLSQQELNNIEKSKNKIPLILKDKNMKVKLNKIIVQSIMKITQDDKLSSKEDKKYLSFVILESLTGKKYKFTSSLSKEKKSNLQKKYQQLIIDEEQLYLFINTILSKSKIILH